MTQRFPFIQLIGTDITQCQHGFAWRLSQHAYAAELVLKADPEDANHLLFVTLNGDGAFNTVWGRMPQPGSATVLPLDTHSLVIELPDNPRTIGNSETPGALIIAPEDKFLAVRNVINGELHSFRYISLQNFTVHDRLPQRIGVFDKWRLTTADANAVDRSILVSVGEWI